MKKTKTVATNYFYEDSVLASDKDTGFTNDSPNNNNNEDRSLQKILWISIIAFLLLNVFFIAPFSSSNHSSEKETSNKKPYYFHHSSHKQHGFYKSAALEVHPNSPKAKNPLHQGIINGVIVILSRNSEKEALKTTLEEFERRFNANFGYPYLILNDVPFQEDFIQEVGSLCPDRTEFALIPHEHWSYPSWINQTHAEACREDYAARGVLYGGSESYRFMCRYNSGFFYKHPRILQYDYYWRIEPGVSYTCNIPSDPFVELVKNDKLYGFVITLKEIPETIPSLWKATQHFLLSHNTMKKSGKKEKVLSSAHDLPARNSSMLAYIVNDYHSMFKHEFQLSDSEYAYRLTLPDISYNNCHYWSNFEIASLSLWRNSLYQDYFNYLDSTGGFFYERWGDAPVHSLALSLFLPKDKIHFFENIGYRHPPFERCPISMNMRESHDCGCLLTNSFDFSYNSCLFDWNKA